MSAWSLYSAGGENPHQEKVLCVNCNVSIDEIKMVKLIKFQHHCNIWECKCTYFKIGIEENKETTCLKYMTMICQLNHTLCKLDYLRLVLVIGHKCMLLFVLNTHPNVIKTSIGQSLLNG